MSSISNYILTKDIRFYQQGVDVFQITDPLIASELNDNFESEKFYAWELTNEISIATLEPHVPYRSDTYEFGMIWACLTYVYGLQEGYFKEDSLGLWKCFLHYVKVRSIPLTTSWISDDTVAEFSLNSHKMSLKYGLIETGKAIHQLRTVCINLDFPFLDFNIDFSKSIDKGNSEYGYEPLRDKIKQEFLLTSHVAKNIYHIFKVPTIKPVNPEHVGQGGFIIDAVASPFPMHKHFHHSVGMCGSMKGEFCSTILYPHSENFVVKYQRGALHHLADQMGWILGAMAVKSYVELAVSAGHGHVYKISDTYHPKLTSTLKDNVQSLYFDRWNDWKMLPKKSYAFVLDKNEESENVVTQSNREDSSLSRSGSIHNYGRNSVFQKFARRDVQAVTTDKLKERLFAYYSGNNIEPFFVKSISGKYVIDVVGKTIPKSTYAVKEGRAGISHLVFETILGKISVDKEHPDYKNIASSILYRRFLKKSIYGSDEASYHYLLTLENHPDPQWIISDVVDMHDEYRIFVVNHKVVVGSPCHRRSTPFNMYPIGRFHPGLCFSHRSRNIRLSQKTRNRVAKYIKFARSFAKELKTYGETHNDYDVAIFGNYVLDVAWSNEKDDVLAIEINECGVENPGNTGMYAMNTVKLVSAYLKRHFPDEKYSPSNTREFASLVSQFGFCDVNDCGEQEYSFVQKKEPCYMDKENLPYILRKVIDTGKANLKHRFINNIYLKDLVDFEELLGVPMSVAIVPEYMRTNKDYDFEDVDVDDAEPFFEIDSTYKEIMFGEATSVEHLKENVKL